MTIELAAPPRVVDPCSYKEIMRRVVEANGEWLRLTFDEVTPSQPPAVKRTRLWQAADARGLKVQVTIQEGSIYVRLLGKKGARG
jgi:hypothetical protein